MSGFHLVVLLPMPTSFVNASIFTRFDITPVTLHFTVLESMASNWPDAELETRPNEPNNEDDDVMDVLMSGRLCFLNQSCTLVIMIVSMGGVSPAVVFDDLVSGTIARSCRFDDPNSMTFSSSINLDKPS